MKEVKCFDDLVFGIHPSAGRGSVQAMHELPNGIVISVVGGFPSETHMRLGGDGVHTFEVVAWRKEEEKDYWLDLSRNGSSILTWQNREEITEVIKNLLAM
jgi:hypothetical protein